jgi:hypothetical protein
MKNTRHMPTLDRPVLYEIKVPGEIDPRWQDWISGLSLHIEFEGDRQRLTTLTGALDQAALHGVIRWLYDLGLPLISVICLDWRPESREEPPSYKGEGA